MPVMRGAALTGQLLCVLGLVVRNLWPQIMQKNCYHTSVLTMMRHRMSRLHWQNQLVTR